MRYYGLFFDMLQRRDSKEKSEDKAEQLRKVRSTFQNLFNLFESIERFIIEPHDYLQEAQIGIVSDFNQWRN